MKKAWKALLDYFKNNAKEPSTDKYVEGGTAQPVDALTCGVLGSLVFILYYKIAYGFCISDSLQDMKAHAIFAQNFYLKPQNFWEAWLKVPHMLWHLVVKTLESRLHFPLWNAASFTFALFGLFAFFVMTWFLYGLLKGHTGQKRLAYASLGAAALSFVGPYVCEWLTFDAYLGAFSPNPLHNPTHIASKGFGMLAMMAGIDVIRKYKRLSPLYFKKGVYVWFAISALLSVIAKPTFMYMLMPAGVVILLIDLISAINACLVEGSKEEGQNGKEKKQLAKRQVEARSRLSAVWGGAWKLALATLPACAYVLTEYVALFYYGTEKGSGVVLTKPLEVWHFYIADVKVAILLGMCFPLWMLLTNLGYFTKSAEGKLSLMGYAFGVLEFSILAESGSRKDAGNFAWCMMAGMTVFFAVAVYRLMLVSLQQRTGKAKTAYLIFSWFLLALHVYSCLSYFEVFSTIL
ncbi:MAG: hypothetical protein K6F31_06825 [Acetatifactor sp.]|nr:hypothetical protein [Acetatifactor sp.]